MTLLSTVQLSSFSTVITESVYSSVQQITQTTPTRPKLLSSTSLPSSTVIVTSTTALILPTAQQSSQTLVASNIMDTFTPMLSLGPTTIALSITTTQTTPAGSDVSISLVGAVVGGVLILLLILIVVIVCAVVVYRRRKNSSSSTHLLGNTETGSK